MPVCLKSACDHSAPELLQKSVSFGQNEIRRVGGRRIELEEQTWRWSFVSGVCLVVCDMVPGDRWSRRGGTCAEEG